MHWRRIVTSAILDRVEIIGHQTVGINADTVGVDLPGADGVGEAQAVGIRAGSVGGEHHLVTDLEFELGPAGDLDHLIKRHRCRQHIAGDQEGSWRDGGAICGCGTAECNRADRRRSVVNDGKALAGGRREIAHGIDRVQVVNTAIQAGEAEVRIGVDGTDGDVIPQLAICLRNVR